MKATRELVETGITNALGSLRDELQEKAQEIADSINQKAALVEGTAFTFPISGGIKFKMDESGKLSAKGHGGFGVRVSVSTIECPLDDHPTLDLEDQAEGDDSE